MYGAWLPIFVFLAVYIVITLEIVNKAVAVLLGVTVLLIFRVVDEHTAMGFIDYETIMLLLGMMAIVAILKKTMLFAFVSVKIAELTQGSPLKILILFSIVTAFLSAFLDNVTTVLIVIPIVIQLTAGMGLDVSGNLAGGTGCHNPATLIATIGSQIDNPVRSFDNVHVVFDYQHRIAAVDQPLQGVQQFADIIKMQAGGGFVKYEQLV